MRSVLCTCDRLASLLHGETIAESDSAEGVGNSQLPTDGKLQKIKQRSVLKWGIAIVLLIMVLGAGGYYGWRAWRHYQYKHYMQEHGNLTPNTPEGADKSGATLTLPSEGFTPKSK